MRKNLNICEIYFLKYKMTGDENNDNPGTEQITAFLQKVVLEKHI